MVSATFLSPRKLVTGCSEARAGTGSWNVSTNVADAISRTASRIGASDSSIPGSALVGRSATSRSSSVDVDIVSRSGMSSRLLIQRP